MRLDRVCILLPALLAASLAPSAGGSLPRHDLTIVMQFDGAASTRAVEAMKSELARILTDSGIDVSWRLRDELNGESFPDLVMVRFAGRCVMETTPLPVYDERGPLAWTKTAEGEPLPFGVVSCDQVRTTVQAAMWGESFSRGDLLFGRALGRVLAHEVYHMLAKTTVHGRSGVTQAALSGAQLIADKLDLDAPSMANLQRAFR